MHDSKANHDFVTAFKAAYGSDQLPTFEAVQAYDALGAAYKVLEAQKGVIDPDKTMELVKGMKFESPRGPIEIDPQTRDIIQNVYFRKVERKNGLLGNYEFSNTPMVKDPNELPAP
jgi:branched-chain amino acid transport system substrate-binding protein